MDNTKVFVRLLEEKAKRLKDAPAAAAYGPLYLAGFQSDDNVGTVSIPRMYDEGGVQRNSLLPSFLQVMFAVSKTYGCFGTFNESARE